MLGLNLSKNGNMDLNCLMDQVSVTTSIFCSLIFSVSLLGVCSFKFTLSLLFMTFAVFTFVIFYKFTHLFLSHIVMCCSLLKCCILHFASHFHCKILAQLQVSQVKISLLCPTFPILAENCTTQTTLPLVWLPCVLE